MLGRLLLFLFLFFLLLLRLRLGARRRLGLRPGLRLHLRLRPGLRLRARLHLRLRLHLGLRPRLRLNLGLRLRPGLDLRLGPRLHLRLDLRRRLGFYPGLDLRLDFRRSLRLRLGLAGGAAALQFLVFYFLLPPLLRRQALVALGQGRAARLGGLGGSRRDWGPRADTRAKFSRFGPTGWRDPGLNLGRLGRNARLHLPGSGVIPRLDLARLARYDGLPWSRSARRSGLSRLNRDAGFDLPRLHLRRSRLGRHRFEGLRLRRLEPLLRRQLLDLLGHLGGQGHGGLGGQRRARQAPARL